MGTGDNWDKVPAHSEWALERADQILTQLRDTTVERFAGWLLDVARATYPTGISADTRTFINRLARTTVASLLDPTAGGRFAELVELATELQVTRFVHYELPDRIGNPHEEGVEWDEVPPHELGAWLTLRATQTLIDVQVET